MGVERIPKLESAQEATLEKKILPPLLQGFEPGNGPGAVKGLSILAATQYSCEPVSPSGKAFGW